MPNVLSSNLERYIHMCTCRTHASAAKVQKHSQCNHSHKLLTSQPPAAKFAAPLAQQDAVHDLFIARAAAGATATTSQSLSSIELNTLINTQVDTCSIKHKAFVH